ncbi:MAG: hypothetical protein HQL52_13010 [Magnetococcales bacterium]|nr:hypothetical protein [Magnetococcales bacterium]
MIGKKNGVTEKTMDILPLIKFLLEKKSPLPMAVLGLIALGIHAASPMATTNSELFFLLIIILIGAGIWILEKFSGLKRDQPATSHTMSEEEQNGSSS